MSGFLFSFFLHFFVTFLRRWDSLIACLNNQPSTLRGYLNGDFEFLKSVKGIL